MPRPKQRTPELKEALLCEAAALLAAGGAAALTTRAVADRAGTSTAAVYELLGDKAGLVRELFFEGFHRLARAFDAAPTGTGPRAHLQGLLNAYRQFAQEHPALLDVMFGRPFQDFEPNAEDLARVQACYAEIMRAVSRACSEGLIAGDPVDLANVLLASVQGLVAAERSGRLGKKSADRDRRFQLAFDALMTGLAPNAHGAPRGSKGGKAPPVPARTAKKKNSTATTKTRTRT